MILVTGGGGQLGRALARTPGVVALDRDALDVTDARAVWRTVCGRPWTAVVNAAAFTAVDAAESHRAEALAVNGHAPGELARACAAVDVPLVHVSTDFVLPGHGGPHAEDVPVAPRGWYATTKARGEEAVRAVGGPHAIVRTSWVFDGGQGFVAFVLGRARAGRALRVTDDRGSPTPAPLLAEALQQLIAEGARGTWHVAGHPGVSRADWARALVAASGGRAPVAEVPLASWPAPAPRPADHRLDVSRALGAGLDLDWRRALAAVVR